MKFALLDILQCLGRNNCTLKVVLDVLKDVLEKTLGPPPVNLRSDQSEVEVKLIPQYFGLQSKYCLNRHMLMEVPLFYIRTYERHAPQKYDIL